MNTQKMIANIKYAFATSQMDFPRLSMNQLYTRCTASSKDAPVFFSAMGELLSTSRLEAIGNGYKLNL